MAKRVCAIVAALAALAIAAPALAQTAATGTVEGLIRDATGGVLPGVTVIVRNVDTNVARETVSDEGGRYRAPALQPGRYEVSATLAGFESAKVGDVIVQVGQTVPIDVQMRAAGVSETLTVTGESPVIDVAKTDVSNVIGQQAIENLPINGRRWENFVLLSPGVTNDGNFGLVSYRGISGLYNNNTVDGVDNNQAFFSEARGRTRTWRRLLLPSRRCVPGAGAVHAHQAGRAPSAVRREHRRPDQARSRVLLRQLRPAAARLPRVRPHGQRDVPRLGVLGPRLRVDAGVHREPRRLLPARG
jgi:hypothetical protein